MSRLEEIKKRANDVRVSDHFGHDTTALLHWESQQLGLIQDDCLYLLSEVERLEKLIPMQMSALISDNARYVQMCTEEIKKRLKLESKLKEKEKELNRAVEGLKFYDSMSNPNGLASKILKELNIK